MTICCAEDCKLNKLNCIFCIMKIHKGCNKFMIRLEDIIEGNISNFGNWYDDAMVTEIASLAE